MKCITYDIILKKIKEIESSVAKSSTKTNKKLINELEELKSYISERNLNYQRAFNLTGDAIWILDKDQNILEANSATEQIFDVLNDETLHSKCYTIAHKSDKPIINCPFIKMKKTLKREKNVWKAADKWFEVTVEPIINENNELEGAIHVTRDITEQKNFQLKLEEQNRKLNETLRLFRTMSDTMTDMLWAKDLNKRYIFANKSLCENLLNAKDTEEPLGKTDLFFAKRERETHPENPEWHTFGELCVDSDETTLNANKPMTFNEYGNVKGKFLYLEVNKAPMYDANGKIIGIVGSARDVTQQKLYEKILRESEARYKELFETAPVGYVILDKNGFIIDLNKTVIKRFNYSREELIGKNIREFVPKEDIKIVDKNIKTILTKGELATEARTLTKNGITLDLLLREKRITLPNGEYGILSASLDISEKKKAERALREKEEQLLTLINSTPDDIISFKDNEGRWLLANDTLIKLFDLENKEYSGKTDLEIANKINPHYLSAFRSCVESDLLAWKEHKPIYTIHSFEKPNGKKLIFDIVRVPLFYENGEKKGIVLFGRDITAREESKKLLQESEEKFRLIWENSINPMRLQDENQRLILVNKAFCDLVEMKREEIIGKKITEIFKVKKRAVKNYKKRFLGNNLPKHHQTEVTLKNGETRLFEFSNSFVNLKDGRKLLFTIFKDVTEVYNLINELTVAKEKAEEINRLKSQFFLYMSHELRTPFMGIVGFAQLIEENAKEKETKEMASNILKTSTRMIETLSNILDLTKIEFDKNEIKLEEINLNLLIREVTNTFYNSAAIKKLKLLTDIPDNVIYINSDRKILMSILNNLINNAIKFTEKGYVKISLRLLKYSIVIKVKDTGIGIQQNKQSIIWHEFRQASEGTSRLHQGSGIGLTIVKKFTEILGGNVSLRSAYGKGSTFTVKFPINSDEINKKE